MQPLKSNSRILYLIMVTLRDMMLWCLNLTIHMHNTSPSQLQHFPSSLAIHLTSEQLDKMVLRPWEYHDYADYLRVVKPTPPRPFKWHDDFLPHITTVSQRLYELSERSHVANQRVEKLLQEERLPRLTHQGRIWWHNLFWGQPTKNP